MGGRISIGLKVINFKDVLYCKAEGNYTRIFIEKNTFIEAHNLKVMESRLPAELFFRIHKSLLVNILFIISINSNLVVLKTGIELKVARRKKRELLKFLSKNRLIVKSNLRIFAYSDH